MKWTFDTICAIIFDGGILAVLKSIGNYIIKYLVQTNIIKTVHITGVSFGS